MFKYIFFFTDVYQSNDTDPSLTDNSGTSGSSTNTVIFNPQKPSPLDISKQSHGHPYSPMHVWNPVLDRLTGHNKQLRNESYYMVILFAYKIVFSSNLKHFILTKYHKFVYKPILNCYIYWSSVSSVGCISTLSILWNPLFKTCVLYCADFV